MWLSTVAPWLLKMHLMAQGRVYDIRVLARVTFTDPAVASVGLTERQAEEAGYTVRVAFLPLGYVPRALAKRFHV
jgi:mercuric reductase